jgi:hypothetical protein
MFENADEIKEFIIWARENKLKHFKIKDIEFELSELSFVEEVTAKQDEILKEAIGDTLVDTEEINPKEEDDLLFWSSDK